MNFRRSVVGFEAFGGAIWWQVYKQVCAACHVLKSVPVLPPHQRLPHGSRGPRGSRRGSHRRTQPFPPPLSCLPSPYFGGRAPNDEGKMFKRPGRGCRTSSRTTRTRTPSPPPSPTTAPSLPNSPQIVNARHGEEGSSPSSPPLPFNSLRLRTTIFWLLMGYPEEGAPAGVKLAGGPGVQPVLRGGASSACPASSTNEGVEYDDGGRPPPPPSRPKDVATLPPLGPPTATTTGASSSPSRSSSRLSSSLLIFILSNDFPHSLK